MTGKTNVGLLTGVPPAPLIADVRAVTWSASSYARERLGVAAQAEGIALGLVQVGLEVLERRGEVEDVDIPTAA